MGSGAELLSPGSVYTATCEHTSGEIESAELFDGDDISIPASGPNCGVSDSFVLMCLGWL